MQQPTRQGQQRAAVLVEPRRIEVRDDVEVTPPGPGELLIRVEAATTCGTDLKMFRRGHPLFALPTRFGHEFSGVVAARGEGVSRFAVGDAVMAVHSAPCGSCRTCSRGLENLCETLVSTMALGAYGEFVRLPARHVAVNVVARPDDVSAAEGSLLEPLACVVYGWRQLTLAAAKHAGVRPRVLVYGAGSIALMFVLLAREEADARVVVVARRPEARQRALEFGAEAAVAPEDAAHALTNLDGPGGTAALADAAVDCTGSPEVWQRLVDLVELGGEVLFYGGCPSGTTVTFDTRRLHYDQLHLHGVFHFDPQAVRDAARWIASRRLGLTRLLEGTYPLAELPAVFDRLDQGQAALKQVILPGAST